METRNLSALRRLSVLAVALNLLAVITVGLALPAPLRVLLPILGLSLPLLTMAGLEAWAECGGGASEPRDDSARHPAAHGGAQLANVS